MVSFNSCQAKNISQAKMTALKLCSIRYVNTRFWSLIIGKSSIVDIWNSFQNLDGYACLKWEFWRETDGFIGVLVWEQLGWFKVSDTRSYLSWGDISFVLFESSMRCRAGDPPDVEG